MLCASSYGRTVSPCDPSGKHTLFCYIVLCHPHHSMTPYTDLLQVHHAGCGGTCQEQSRSKRLQSHMNQHIWGGYGFGSLSCHCWGRYLVYLQRCADWRAVSQGLPFANSCYSNNCFFFSFTVILGWFLFLEGVPGAWKRRWFIFLLCWLFFSELVSVCARGACMYSFCTLPEEVALERDRNICLLLEEKMWERSALEKYIPFVGLISRCPHGDSWSQY